MSADIPASTRDLFDRPILCALSTVNPDGQPHTVPVWCDYDGTYFRVNSPASTRKSRNMDVDTKVTAMLLDPENPFHWLEIQGHIVEIRDEANGARDHINALSQKYMNRPVYQDRPGAPRDRLMYLIAVDKTNGR